MGMAKCDPQLTPNQTHKPIVTKFETRNWVADIYTNKFRGQSARDFCPHTREITQNIRMFTSLFCYIRAHTDEPVGPIFAFNTSYNVVQSKEVPFGGENI